MQWSLIVGPGARLAELLAYLVPESSGGDCGAIVELHELGELLAKEPAWNGPARLLIDADALDIGDVGLVRAVMKHGTELELVLLGEDGTRRAARRLARDPRVTWMAWPPDLDDLKRLGRAPGKRAAAAAPAGTGTQEASTTQAPPDADEEEHAMDAVGDELAQIEAILGTPLARRTRDEAEERGADRTAPPAPRSAPAPAPIEHTPAPRIDEPELEPLEPPEPHAEHEPLAEHELQPVPRGSLPTPSFAPPLAPSDTETPARRAPSAELPRAPAPWFQNQVADLADLAQRIELGLTQVREGAQASEEAIEALSTPIEELTRDVARLLQFTRTLGYLVAPPARGAQRFELGELVDLHTRALVERGAEGPRCLARKNGSAIVKSDRQLVSQVLDALFHLAGRAAAAGELVRVQLKTEKDAARLSIEFPAGPLAALAPERIVEPYALRRLFPELGANALAAATGIVRGQGGELALARKGERHLEWTLTLPLEERGAGGASAENPFG